MTSICRCTYEFLQTFRLPDIESVYLKYAERTIGRMRSSSIDDPEVTHYAKVRVTAGSPHHALLTLTILPYGKPLYEDTACVESKSRPGLLPAILYYISGALGEDVWYRVLQRHAGRLVEWLKSAKSISETAN